MVVLLQLHNVNTNIPYISLVAMKKNQSQSHRVYGPYKQEGVLHKAVLFLNFYDSSFEMTNVIFFFGRCQ